MHTAICTFDNQADAERAVERLVQSGFDRNDVHMEYRHADGTPMQTGQRRTPVGDEPLMHGEPAAPGQANDRWDSLEREVAVDSGRVRRLGDFFRRLFGRDEGAAHAGTYSRAVERGHCVVVVDAHSEDEAERAQNMLHGMEARDLTRVHRAGHPPLRDVVAERQAGGMEQRFGTAREDMDATHNVAMPQESQNSEFYRERAMAAQGWGEQRTLDVADRPANAATDQPQSRDQRDPDLRDPREGDSTDKPR